MKQCLSCNQEINEAVIFCPHCGKKQEIESHPSDPRANSSFLYVLCTLTMIGSVFTMGRAYLYEMISMADGSSNYYRGWIYAISAIGTLVGAVIMLQKRFRGLIVYTVSQSLYIITVIIASLSYSDTLNAFDSEGAVGLLASGIAMFFLLPSILFLILYWTPMIKTNFK